MATTVKVSKARVHPLACPVVAFFIQPFFHPSPMTRFYEHVEGHSKKNIDTDIEDVIL